MFATIEGLKGMARSGGLYTAAERTGNRALARTLPNKLRPANKRKKKPTATSTSMPTRRPRLAIRSADRSGVGLKFNG
jgi:hypothetical protein